MVQVKICGITTYEDALMAAESGADMLGFNFYKKSVRYIEESAARYICDTLRENLGERCPLLVGVFVNELVTHISRITNLVGLNFAQLSGDESDAMLKELRGLGFKAIRPMNTAMALDDANYFRSVFPHDERAPSLLLDAFKSGEYGGTGAQVTDEIALALKPQVPRLMLAGGLTADNVAERVAAVQPWGVDVASGVELDGQPGRKDPAKVQAFIQGAKSA
jgi:phosphoribosylanthranilate isomerase